MKITKRAKMTYGAQDGAFWGDFMFRFNANGKACVFDARVLDGKSDEIPTMNPIASFHTAESDALIPHFNAVCFGSEYYAEGDEFPLMYANIYNNYAKAENRLEGTLCVYRMQRDGLDFSMTLVQVIRVGFTEDTTLWKSAGEKPDVRPYGNFVVDTEKNILHAFVMRDAPHNTRYFSFRLPGLADGEFSEEYGVKVVTLEKEDILDSFDTEYHLYIQGACCHNGLIFSSEGFNEKVPPSLRVIDPAEKKQIRHMELVKEGFPHEAEWIDFRNGICWYSDGDGNVYEVDFDL